MECPWRAKDHLIILLCINWKNKNKINLLSRGSCSHRSFNRAVSKSRLVRDLHITNRPPFASTAQALFSIMGLIFISEQCFMKYTVMQTDDPIITLYCINFDVSEQFFLAAITIPGISVAVVTWKHSFFSCRVFEHLLHEGHTLVSAG